MTKTVFTLNGAEAAAELPDGATLLHATGSIDHLDQLRSLAEKKGMRLDAGYEGPFDLEILGPRIEEEGYRAPIARSLDRAGEMLQRLGV